MKNLGVDVSSKLFVSRKAHLIFPTHRLIDQASELSKGKKKIGSTLKGIGPTYMDKTGRNGFRVGELEIDGWENKLNNFCLLYTSPSPRDQRGSRMPSSA